MPKKRYNSRDDGLLLQQHGGSGQEGDPSPVPDHDDEDAGREERLHGKPHFRESSVLMDALRGKRSTVTVCYVCCACSFIVKLSQLKFSVLYIKTNRKVLGLV